MTAPKRRSETIQVEGVRKTRRTPKLTWVEVVRRDMAASNLTADMALNRTEWRNKIRVARIRLFVVGGGGGVNLT